LGPWVAEFRKIITAREKTGVFPEQWLMPVIPDIQRI
jgi:hypothetical protein